MSTSPQPAPVTPVPPSACPVEMQGGLCGRPLHAAPQGADAVPVCLMHSKDPDKHSGPLYSQFFLEFKSILAAAGQGTADFTKFVFPHLSLRSTAIDPDCIFESAIFEEDVDFYQLDFKRSASFTGATFLQGFSCRPATFSREVTFDYVTFNGHTSFMGSSFKKVVTFFGSNFLKPAIFQKATFDGPVDFTTVSFAGETSFAYATFANTVTFENSTFSFTAVFLHTIFKDTADLSHVTFIQGATLPKAEFFQQALFVGAVFAGDTSFFSTTFHRTANFVAAKFATSTSFRETRFLPDQPTEPSAVFALASFPSDGRTIFYKTSLQRALFHNCDVSNVVFSSVDWRKRPGTRSVMVFEEDLPLDNEHASTLINSGGWERDYALIAQLYQQLKKNYDDHLDYWTADHFHFGEMEMQRLAVPRSGPLLKLRQLYHRNLSLVAWYRRGSSYGNGYVRPAIWLLCMLVLFTILFPLPGLQKAAANPASPPPPPLTYSSAWSRQSPPHDKLWAELKLLGKSALTSVDTATFQKSSEYVPAYPYGRALAILETLLTSTLFALFLLAIRRQFRR